LSDKRSALAALATLTGLLLATLVLLVRLLLATLVLLARLLLAAALLLLVRLRAAALLLLTGVLVGIVGVGHRHLLDGFCGSAPAQQVNAQR
jgi:hypothetical protein